MKLSRLFPVLVLFVLAAALLLTPRPQAPAETIRADASPAPAVKTVEFTRDVSALDFSGVKFTPWDVTAAAARVAPQPKRAQTVLIYMNGSDLETDMGAATADLQELLSSGVDPSLINVVLFTGGTNRWRNNVIPANECMLSRVADGGLEKLTGVGLRNMGDAGTLASFLEFGASVFPADKTSLILWDHGGGSIAGYGHDEKFNDSSLTLLEMEYAFERAGLAENRLELLGFDACLMATAEMSVVAARYAGFLVASESLEPGTGWDYTCFGELNRSADMDGVTFGKILTDAFMASGGDASEELTLSVIDTAQAGYVMGALGALTRRCLDELAANPGGGFPALAQKRGQTRTFGVGSPRDNACDMVDVGDMAQNLGEYFPDETRNVLGALARAVVYCRYNSGALSGMSAYYIFGGRADAENSLGVYEALQMSEAYTAYLTAFADALTGREARSVQNTVSARVDGRAVRLYETSRAPDGTVFALPAKVNGAAVDLVVLRENSGGAVLLGYRREEGYIIQKGLDTLQIGDEVELSGGGAFTVARPLTVSLAA
ncbi:MAG: hypothetical protein LBT12_05255 [Oscillospiraceae bacterium]|nr:hypothetical protein [Oscillospiraceae bacterium]